MITRILAIIAIILIWLAPGILLSGILDIVFEKIRRKKFLNEISNPVKYSKIPGVKIKKHVSGNYRNIGGKIGYIDRMPDVMEIVNKASNYNPACLNFVKSRSDLFNDFDDYELTTLQLIKPRADNLRYFYIKIREHNQFIGYIVASDEIEEYINCKEEDYGNN